MKKIILLIISLFFLSLFSIQAQEKKVLKLPGKASVYLELGYMSGTKYLYPNIKLKLGLQKTYYDLIDLSIGYWNFTNNYGDVYKKSIKFPADSVGNPLSKISINSFDLSIGLAPVHSNKHLEVSS